MRVVIQRVTEASVTIEGKKEGAIGDGLLLLLGIEEADSVEDINWICNKIVKLRIFNDEEGVMNKSLKDVEGEILVISQFTLHSSTKKGNRPSYIKAAKPEIAVPLYETFKHRLRAILGKNIESGIFGADMKVALINDGPVTILIDTKNRE